MYSLRKSGHGVAHGVTTMELTLASLSNSSGIATDFKNNFGMTEGVGDERKFHKRNL